jgi:hypothetical protein
MYISQCMRFVAVIVVNVVSGVQGAIHYTLVGRSGGQGRTGASKLWFSGQ